MKDEELRSTLQDAEVRKMLEDADLRSALENEDVRDGSAACQNSRRAYKASSERRGAFGSGSPDARTPG